MMYVEGIKVIDSLGLAFYVNFLRVTYELGPNGKLIVFEAASSSDEFLKVKDYESSIISLIDDLGAITKIPLQKALTHLNTFKGWVTRQVGSKITTYIYPTTKLGVELSDMLTYDRLIKDSEESDLYVRAKSIGLGYFATVTGSYVAVQCFSDKTLKYVLNIGDYIYTLCVGGVFDKLASYSGNKLTLSQDFYTVDFPSGLSYNPRFPSNYHQVFTLSDVGRFRALIAKSLLANIPMTVNNMFR